MRFSAQINYDAAPGDVYAMLVDKAFQDRKLAATGAEEFSSTIVVTGDTAVVTTNRSLPTDKIPDAFRSLVGAKLTVIQVETWKAASASGRDGTVTVQIPGTPLRMTAALRLAAGSGGAGTTSETVDGELKASVPLIGGRIEKAAEPALRAAVDVEQRIGRQWLAGQRG